MSDNVHVHVHIPDNFVEILMEQIRPLIDSALSAVETVPTTIIGTAIAGNDVNGNQMPPKTPKPKHNPTNNPDVPLEASGALDMMSPARWTTERVDDFTATATYTPPDFFDYLIEKPVDQGGRPWMTHEAINQTARQTIEEEMKRRAEEA